MYTAYKPYLNKDEEIIKQLQKVRRCCPPSLCFSCRCPPIVPGASANPLFVFQGVQQKRPSAAQNAILRRYFLELTQSFIIPLVTASLFDSDRDQVWYGEYEVNVGLCVTGAVRGQSDASAEVHQSLEEPSPTPTIYPAGLHEDAGESRTSAHIQTKRRLDRPLQVTTGLRARPVGGCRSEENRTQCHSSGSSLATWTSHYYSVPSF